jgi:hypothetical protein
MNDVLVAGDTLDFSTAVTEFPASDGWTLVYVLVPQFSTPTQTPITITSSTYEVTDYRVSEGPAVTANWAAGAYSWYSYVEKSGARETVGNGLLQIRPNPATLAQGYDSRGHARKVLDAIEAVLEKRATLDQEAYAIGGRQLSRMPVGDLMRFRQRYVAEVATEDAAARLAQGLGGRKIQVRL